MSDISIDELNFDLLEDDMSDKKWKEIDCAECSECGGLAEIFTDLKEHNYGWDGDLVRCTSCKHTGHWSCDEDNATVVWKDVDE